MSRANKRKVLVLAKTLPLHDRASGDFRLTRILEILAKEFEVDFLSTTHTTLNPKSSSLEYFPRDASLPRNVELLDQRYIDDLHKIGVTPLNQANPVSLTIRPGNRYDISPFLESKAYDLIWVEFYYLAAEYLDDIRRLQPQAHIVCDSVDLHFRRLARQCNYNETPGRYTVNSRHERRRPRAARLAHERRHADHVRDLELAAYKKCDAVIMVSEDDNEELKRHCPSIKSLLVPNLHRLGPKSAKGFDERRGCVFVGNFDHDPNLRSAIFLKHEVAPSLGNIPIQIVGSNPPKLVRNLDKFGPRQELFHVTGFVPSTQPYLESARVSVAPILFGAGMNGKIGEALSAGLPVVTTYLGALGMKLEHEKTCLVADTGPEFAAAVERLHQDKELWTRLRENGLRHIEEFCSTDNLKDSLLYAVRSLLPPRAAKDARATPKPTRLAPPRFAKAPAHPKFSVIVLTHNQWPHTELCIRSLAHAEAKNPGLAEYILVDNASTDGTPSFAKKIPGLKVLAQKKNLGFAAGNNLGIREARGENIILLNNDTIVPPEWLKRFEHLADSIPNLGILGPTTNTESGQANPLARYNSIKELFSFNETLAPGSWERVKKISGLCLLLTRQALEKLGPLDTSFGPGYFEDDDLCLRAEDANFTIAWAKDVFVHHFGSASFQHTRQKFLEEGIARFAFKWGKRGLDHIAQQHQENLLRQIKSAELL